MKKVFFQIAVLAAALLSTPPGLRAQQFNTNPVELPSTTVWQQMRYNNVAGASLYTGTVNVNIPLYEYQDADFDIPITLGYASGGYKPNIQAGVVGHDWSLNTGGAITRVVRGLPDETRNLEKYGFLETHNRPDLTSVEQLDGYNTYWDDSGIEATNPTLFYRKDWSTTQNTELLDMEPDIFYFTFLGYSGKFQLGYNGAIHVYDTNTRNAEFRVEVPRYNLDQIVIVTGDGTRYTFGTGLAREYQGQTGTAWKLSSIATPSGRTVTFNYTHSARQYGTSTTLVYNSYNNYAPSSFCYSFNGNYNGYSQTLAIDYRPVLPDFGAPVIVTALNSITVDNGASVNFFYKTVSPVESGENGTTLTILPKLDRVVANAPDGSAVRTCVLSYSVPAASSSNKLPFLTAVDVSGEGTFQMAYNYTSATVFPKHGTFKIDHWGFYNNSSATYLSFYTHQGQDSNLNETGTLAVREPNGTYALLGMLTTLTYPTGGRTVFEYEPNDYSAYSVCEYPDFAPAEMTTPGQAALQAGGVRIKSIKDYLSSSSSAPVYTRTYSYKDGSGHSTGILAPKPRYGISYNKYKVTGDDIDVYLGSYHNLLPADGTHIEYTSVTETLPEGRNVYSFITRADCPDGKVTMDGTNLYNYTYSVSAGWMLGEPAYDAVFAAMSPVTSMQAVRGRLLSKVTYDAQNVARSTSTTTFEPYTYAFESLDKVWNYQSMYIGATRVPTVIGDVRPLSQTTVTDGVSDTETYVYDAFRNVRSRTRGGQTSKYFYLQDIDNLSAFSDLKDYSYWNGFASGTVCAKMKALNMVNLPLQTEAYEDGVLHVRRYIYNFRNGTDQSAVYLQSVQEREASGGWHTLVSYDYRDQRGRVVQMTDADGIKTTFVWGYGGLYPVAQVVGAAYTQLLSITGLNVIVNTALSGGLTAAQATALRALSGAEATVWEYSPLVGLTKETTPDGRSTSYTYNASGKLHQVLDDLGRKTGAYLYSTDNKQQ